KESLPCAGGSPRLVFQGVRDPTEQVRDGHREIQRLGEHREGEREGAGNLREHPAGKTLPGRQNRRSSRGWTDSNTRQSIIYASLPEKRLVNVDVLIAGGGPAGCSAAAALSELGLRVLVADAGIDRTKQLAGELLHPSGVRDLERLGFGNLL